MYGLVHPDLRFSLQLQMAPTIGGEGESMVEIPMVEIDTLVVEGKTFLSTTASIIAHNFDLLEFLNALVLKSTDQVITGASDTSCCRF